MHRLHNIIDYVQKRKHHLPQKYSDYFRFYKNAIFKTRKVINQKEIRILGLRRSGNHAVIVWIRAQNPEYALHINHPPPGTNPYQFLYTHFETPKLRQEAMGNFSHKSLLIISYEDRNLKKVCSEKFEKFHDTYVGCSAKRFDLLLLRDPFNLLASRIKSDMSRLNDASALKAIKLWKAYAKEFVGETNSLTHNKLCVNFNKWHSNRSYRQEIAEQLEIKFTDAGRERVKGYGGGSSFDGLDYDEAASQLKILERWQMYEQVDAFWKLFRDEELLYYAERIFDRETLPFHRVH